MPYLGKSPQTGNYSKIDDISSGFDGSDATHAIASNGVAITPVRPEALIISINGVIQEPVTDYTVSGTDITFTTAPTSGDNFFGVAMGEKLDIGTPSDATITSAKLASTVFTGATDIGANIADADLFLLDDGAGGTIRKTAASRLKTYIGGSDPASADGDSLGTASLEWSDLYLADGGIIYFGNDQDVTLTHVADTGLTLTSADAGAGEGPVLNLYRNSSSPADGDELGQINWTGKNDAGTIDTHGSIRINLDTVNDGAEDASMVFTIFKNGSAVNALLLAASSATTQVVLQDHGTVAQPTLAWQGDLDTGFYHDATDSGVIRVASQGTSRQVWTNAGQVILSDTSNGNMTIGHTINQGSADNHIIDLKSSDIAHPFTGVVEADTYLKMGKGDSSAGNGLIEGFSETTGGLVLRGNSGEANTATSTSGVGTIQIDAYKTDGGTSRAVPGANDNMLSVRSGGNAKFLVKGDGDIYYDGADQGAYDAYDDAHISRALDLSHGNGVIDSKFDKFIAYNHEKLAEMQLVGREEDGTPNHFINVAGMQRLHNGAIWQQYEKHENLLNAVYELAVEAVGEDKANSILDKNDIKLLSNNELLN